MSKINEFIEKIEDSQKRERLGMIVNSLREAFPQLQEDVKWNQPMFIHEIPSLLLFRLLKRT